jgi:hypothetical protein
VNAEYLSSGYSKPSLASTQRVPGLTPGLRNPSLRQWAAPSLRPHRGRSVLWQERLCAFGSSHLVRTFQARLVRPHWPSGDGRACLTRGPEQLEDIGSLNSYRPRVVQAQAPRVERHSNAHRMCKRVRYELTTPLWPCPCHPHRIQGSIPGVSLLCLDGQDTRK